jgi:hypothetical protein
MSNVGRMADGEETPGSAEESIPSERIAWAAVAIALVAAIVGAILFLVTDPDLHLDVQGFAVFAPIYFAAQAIERLLEPLASVYNTTIPQKEAVKSAREQKVRAETALKAALGADPAVINRESAPVNTEMAAATAFEQAALRALRLKRANRKLLWFAVATVIACILSGLLGLGILEAMSTQKLEAYLGAIDVGLTGVVIGAGTKPIHDLIERVQKSKENADPATKPTQMLPGTPGAQSPS